MKIVCIVVFSLLFSLVLQAQDAEHNTSKTPEYNMYGNLRDDNPVYSPKAPLWRPLVGVIGSGVFTNLTDTYILKKDFTRVGFVSWGQTLSSGPPWSSRWMWDAGRFGNNFFNHPYGGGAFFNAARAHGYNFYESIPYAFVGSYMWKMFGENGHPEREDLINTTVSGAFLGEIEYRLSSYFLDDRTTGPERVFRELFAAAIDPSRAFSRFLDGNFSRVTTEEIYQKEPLNLTFSAGIHRINDGRSFGTGLTAEMLTLHLDYGNPFEHRTRKPFDYFKLHADLTFGGGTGRKTIDNVLGTGMWVGKNVQSGNTDMLIGLVQHYDYWDNWTFELATIAFGPGIIAKTPLSENANLYSEVHLAIVPFGGNSGLLGPDTSQFRDYNFGGGAEGKVETTLNLGGWLSVTLRGYYYWFHTWVGNAGNNFIGVVKPSVAFRVVSTLSLGFEQLMYYGDRYPLNYPQMHQVRTEQKIFLQYYIDNFKQEK
jgi:hypothetical protein